MFWKTTKNASVTFWDYDNILLRLYIHIAKTGEFFKLVRSGEADQVKCLELWEQLVKRQEKETGLNKYNTLLTMSKAYLTFYNDHKTIRASLIRVALMNRQTVDISNGSLIWINLMDVDDLNYLDRKGYSVDLSSYDKVIESVTARLRKCENLISKAVSKKKELEKMLEGGHGKEEGGFEQVMAQLNFALGFVVGEDVTLARFNEYQKILKERQKSQEEANRKGNGK